MYPCASCGFQSDGTTPLHLAAKCLDPSLLVSLLARGAAVDAVTVRVVLDCLPGARSRTPVVVLLQVLSLCTGTLGVTDAGNSLALSHADQWANAVDGSQRVGAVEARAVPASSRGQRWGVHGESRD